MDVLKDIDRVLADFDASGLPREEAPSTVASHSQLRQKVSGYLAGCRFIVGAFLMGPIDLIRDAAQ